MKRLMLAVAALAFSASATAQWIQIGETHDTVLFHALDTLRKDGNLRRVWEIQDFKSDVFGDGVRSLRYQSEYDCMGGRLRVLYLQAFKSQMAVGEALNVPFNGQRLGARSCQQHRVNLSQGRMLHVGEEGFIRQVGIAQDLDVSDHNSSSSGQLAWPG
jgi:hypothetical protein